MVNGLYIIHLVFNPWWFIAIPVEIDRFTTRLTVSVYLFLAELIVTGSARLYSSPFCPYPRAKTVPSESVGVRIVSSKPEVYLSTVER